MEKYNLKRAIVVSSLTFGIGHIVNLFNGSGQELVSTMIQIVFAVLVGFLLVLIFYYGGSLVPCILFHSTNNSIHAFTAESNMNSQIEITLNIVLIVVVLGGYLFYLIKTFSENKE